VMKPNWVTWLVRAGIAALAACVALAFGIFLGQCLYWLRFGRWPDWALYSDHAIPRSRLSGEHWRGAQKLIEWLTTAPVELATFVAGVTLVALYIWLRISARR